MGTMSESPEQREHDAAEDAGDAENGEGGVERTGGDQDSGPSGTADQVDVDEQRDQAEG
jgi:hypothetical protein